MAYDHAGDPADAPAGSTASIIWNHLVQKNEVGPAIPDALLLCAMAIQMALLRTSHAEIL